MRNSPMRLAELAVLRIVVTLAQPGIDPGEPVEGLSRRLAVPVWKLEEWRQRGLAGIDACGSVTTIRRRARSPRRLAASAS